jgi:DNA-binding response OmpR family regulator
MGVKSRWEKYPLTYRAEELRRLAGWIAAGESGAVVGLPGTGRATFLNVLCGRPAILQEYLPAQNQQVVLVPVDLNNLPGDDLATLYRVILRSFYEIRERFDGGIETAVTELYQKHEAACDPFLPQSALIELLLKFEAAEMKVVLVMNRFDRFCESATPQMTRTLRGLRDRFKESLCYIIGMSQEVTYFADLPSVAPLYNILDTHVLWIRPLNREDAFDMIKREMEIEADETGLETLLSLTGGYPSLIRVVCHWWLETDRNQANFGERLLTKKSVRNRLTALFNALTQEEQSLLRDIAGRRKKERSKHLANPSKDERRVLEGLAKKGICRGTEQGWEIPGRLVENYPQNAPGQSGGRIWLREKTGEICQGNKPVTELTPLEQAVLKFFIENPQQRLTYSDLIDAAWDEPNVEGVTTEAVYQVIRGMRKKVEPEASNPHHIVNWRGKPEGGYQFFPEGRPA